MLRRIVCEGAPRDLGLDQGRACRDAIREAVDAPSSAFGGWIASLRRASTLPSRFARELRRHFPHLAERVEGLARGADVEFALLVEALEFELSDPKRAALDAGVTDGPVLRARFGADHRGTCDLVLRESRPEVGYRSLALVRPWRVASLAGVNEAGLAMVCATRSGEAASAALLGEQCLERFDRVPNALEWCERRPGRGAVRLVFADAAGGVGALEIAGDERRPLDAAALREATSSSEPGPWIRLDPESHRLFLAEKPNQRGSPFSF